jgi:hypothetical protein
MSIISILIARIAKSHFSWFESIISSTNRMDDMAHDLYQVLVPNNYSIIECTKRNDLCKGLTKRNIKFV